MFVIRLLANPQSLGYPLFFAARGEGVVRDGEDVPYPFRTAAKVLISGLGADE